MSYNPDTEGRIAPIGAAVDKRLQELEQSRKRWDKRRTRYWLALQMNVSHGSLHDLLENHRAGIRWPMLAKLCKALECQPGDLLQYIPPGSINGIKDK